MENGMERYVELKHDNQSTIWVRGETAIGVRSQESGGGNHVMKSQDRDGI